jgi:hypothetical protein
MAFMADKVNYSAHIGPWIDKIMTAADAAHGSGRATNPEL